MNTYYKIGAIVIALLVAFAFGKYTTPERIVVKTEVKEVVVEKESSKKDVSVSETSEEIVIVKPDGTRIVKKKYKKEDKKKEEVKKEVVEYKESKSEKLVENNKAQWAVGALWNPAGTYGAQVERRILGPVFVGAWGMTDRQYGIGVKVEF